MHDLVRMITAVTVMLCACWNAGGQLMPGPDDIPPASDDPLAPVLVEVRGGAFRRGPGLSDAEQAQHLERETPARTIILSPYRIGKYEITTAQYVAVMNWAWETGKLSGYDGGNLFLDDVLLLMVLDWRGAIAFQNARFYARRDGDPKSDRAEHPVTMVTWYGAVAYCNWLSEIHGLEPCYDLETWSPIHPWPNGYRLPTEAEWERAASWLVTRRGVTRLSHSVRKEPEEFTFFYNYRPGYYRNPHGMWTEPYTSPVTFFEIWHGRHSASGAGCYDMAGNVWEWCSDWYAPDYYRVSPIRDPLGPESGQARVSRGGSWNSRAMYCRSAYRNYDEPGFYHYDLGFRVARSGHARLGDAIDADGVRVKNAVQGGEAGGL